MSRSFEELKHILDIIGVEIDSISLTPELLYVLNLYGEFEYQEGNNFGYDSGYNDGYHQGRGTGYNDGYESGRASE